MKDPIEIIRNPILINEHTVALLTMFVFAPDSFDDLWALDWLQQHGTVEKAAEEFVKQLCHGDHWSPHFLICLRREITKKLREEDQERNVGTDFEHAE